MIQYSSDNEIRILQTIVDSKDSKIKHALLGKLEPEYFGFPLARTAFTRIKNLVKAGKDIPSGIAMAGDPGLAKEEHDLFLKTGVLLIESHDVEHLIDSTRTYWKVRYLAEIMRDTAKELAEADKIEDIDKITDNLEKGMFRAKTGRDESESVHIGFGDNSTELVDEILASPKTDLIPTGFEVFDERTGGWNRGNMIVYAANAGGGKSALALQTAINQYRAGYNVCMISLEMGRAEVIERAVSNISSVSHAPIRKHKTDVAQKAKARTVWNSFVEEGKARGNRFSIICPRSAMSFGEVLLEIKTQNYDVVFVDYLNLLSGAGDADKQWQVLGSMAKEAKNAARNLNNIFVVLTQLDDFGNIKYSRGIMEHADFVWTWQQNEKSESSNLVDIVQKKARGAARYTLTLEQNLDCMQFQQWFSADDERYMAEEKARSGKSESKAEPKKVEVKPQPKVSKAEVTKPAAKPASKSGPKLDFHEADIE